MNRIQVNLLKDKFEVPDRDWLEEVFKQHPQQIVIPYKNLSKISKKDIYLTWRDEGISILDRDFNIISEIPYDSITYVNFSMCSRNSGLRYNRYQVDLDVVTADKEVQFEIFEPTSLQDLIDQLVKNNIECVDIVGVVELYKQYPERDKRIRYLDFNFNQIAKKFQLDHPRWEENLRESLG